jgi:predicted dehydrogenase
LRNALLPILREGGIALSNSDRSVPRILLAGRDEQRLRAVSDSTGIPDWTTDIAGALANSDYPVYFDVASTGGRAERLLSAIAAGKHVYTDKPLASTLDEATAVASATRAAGIKHGMVCDKIFLPGLLKLKGLVDGKFFGRILSIRIEFGWWIFDGETAPSQRQSWNYQLARGGGIVLDMLPHWSYVLGHLFGRPVGLFCQTATHQPVRWDETGARYDVDVEDAASVLMELDSGAKVQLLTSWATRVRRDDMMIIQVDGTKGSAVASLRDCWTQTLAETPTPIWPQLEIQRPRADHFSEWRSMPETDTPPASFRAGWELYLRHIAEDAPFPFPLDEGVRAMQLIDCAYASAREKRWVEVGGLVRAH